MRRRFPTDREGFGVSLHVILRALNEKLKRKRGRSVKIPRMIFCLALYLAAAASVSAQTTLDFDAFADGTLAEGASVTEDGFVIEAQTGTQFGFEPGQTGQALWIGLLEAPTVGDRLSISRSDGASFFLEEVTYAGQVFAGSDVVSLLGYQNGAIVESLEGFSSSDVTWQLLEPGWNAPIDDLVIEVQATGSGSLKFEDMVLGQPVDLGVDPANVDFGGLNVGTTSAAETVTLSGLTAAAVTIDNLPLSGAGFAIAGGDCPTTPFSLELDETCTLDLVFTPDAAGAFSGTLMVESNGDSSPQSVSLSGTGLVPSLDVSPASLDFGEVDVGDASPAASTVLENAGNGDLNVGTLSISGGASGDFSIDTDSCSGQTLAPGATCSVAVIFSPTSSGARDGQLDIASNASSSPDAVSLTGTGAVPTLTLSTGTLDFGVVAAGETATASLTVANSGAGDLVVQDVIQTGEYFAISGGSCLPVPVTLAQGSSCELTVQFGPAPPRAVQGQLEIVSNADSSPDLVGLTGQSMALPVPALGWQGLFALSLGLMLAGLFGVRRLSP